MNYYKYMKADDFCNYFYENPKLKMSKLSDFSDIYEPETLLQEPELMHELELIILKKSIKNLPFCKKLFHKALIPRKISEIFNKDTNCFNAKIFRTLLIMHGEEKYTEIKTTYFELLSTSTSEIKKVIDKLSQNLLVLCLSYYNGSQILYEKYGEHKGVMLEFNDKYIRNNFKVNYGTNQRKKYFVESLDKLLDAIINNDVQTLEHIFLNLFAFKNNDYKHEHEYRILVYADDIIKIPEVYITKNGIYLIDISMPISITLGYKFNENDGPSMRKLAIKDFCKKHNIKLYQATKSVLDDETMQREEIEL